MAKIPKTRELFDLSHTLVGEMLSECEYPYEALGKIGEFAKEISKKLDSSYREIAPEVYAAEDAIISERATLIGPAVIGHNAEIRPGAYIRGKVIIGDGAVIGNSTEIKNSIIFDNAQLPHYNYVGDSIIGYRAHLGAGAIASNLRLDKKEIKIDGENTGLRKIGTFLGDSAEVGCNSVLCPGSVVGKEAFIYPLSRVKGVIPEGTIFDGENFRKRKEAK
jgi:NDP-sugar pyrophosphorylase family protein